MATHLPARAVAAAIKIAAATMLLEEGNEAIKQSAHDRPMLAPSLTVRQRLLLDMRGQL
jgi:hypothetical protein